jgi:hypothetical protein
LNFKTKKNIKKTISGFDISAFDAQRHTVSMKSKGERNNNACNTNCTSKRILFSSAPFSFCVSFCVSSSGHGASSVPCYPSHRRARTAVRGSRTWRP